MDLPWQAVVSAENLGASMTVVSIVSFGSISALKRMSPHTSLSKSEERNQKKKVLLDVVSKYFTIIIIVQLTLLILAQ